MMQYSEAGGQGTYTTFIAKMSTTRCTNRAVDPEDGSEHQIRSICNRNIESTMLATQFYNQLLLNAMDGEALFSRFILINQPLTEGNSTTSTMHPRLPPW